MQGMNGYHIRPVTLSFTDAELEDSYRRQEPVRRLPFIRPALLLLIPLIGLFGFLDAILIPELEALAWQIRLYLSLCILAVFGLTYTYLVYSWLQWALAALVLIFGACTIVLLLTATETVYYYVGLILLMMFAYFSGLRFIFAFVTSTLILLTYFGVSLWLGARSGFAVEVPFLLAGYIIAAFAGHTSERQRRKLFAQSRIIDEERRQHAQMAMHDPLTELPNRHLLDERMTQSLARARRQGTQFAVLFIDLDNFKSVNDNYGHMVGDQVLKVIADRLRDHVRMEDTAARLGGDEFVILSEYVNDEEGVQIAATRLLATISAPVVINLRESDTIKIKVTGSVGISLCPRDGTSLEELIARADEAMYEAKSKGTGKIRFFGKDSTVLSGTESSSS